MEKQRIVIKIGSSSLSEDKGGLSPEKLEHYVSAIAGLRKAGHEVILVSSGAVAAGFQALGYPNRPVTIEGKQASAAVGQGLLIHAYTTAFHKHEIVSAQLLLTRDSFTDQHQYSNVFTTLSELMKRSVLPIINENDSVSIDELTFGDNDMLSTLVSGLMNADYLFLLTDIDGIYPADPRSSPSMKRYQFLPSISDELIHSTSSHLTTKFGTGGIKSKLIAAKTATSLGVKVFIGNGGSTDDFQDILNGKGNGTYIGVPSDHGVGKSKQWIAFHSLVQGLLIIDPGAEQAISTEGKSLLPAGIIDIQGNFSVGEVVEVRNLQDEMVAKGQVSYSSQELQMIKGLRSQDAMKQTNQSKAEAIHRDKMVVLRKEGLV
ncbi:glutamate 5-kinase [Radiobacillus deserti]|uniref:Glutamate 5-kinase n=1 Tax=Radiobacillus deserti TaxID=2594883 RepID=A0A516KG09_9BACI|nr:glutamate 5-kinase [Radiobacillus deserti]QDP40333.1 glutamate 5-kinase [Radiobacillus deserti]